jgi:hypothetical protein
MLEGDHGQATDARAKLDEPRLPVLLSAVDEVVLGSSPGGPGGCGEYIIWGGQALDQVNAGFERLAQNKQPYVRTHARAHKQVG